MGRGDYMSNRQSRSSGQKRAVSWNPAVSEQEPPQKSWKDGRQAELKEDDLLGFVDLPPGSPPRVGWLLNMVPGTVEEPVSQRPVQAVDLFFISEDSGASDFRVSIITRPYMYVAVAAEYLRETEVALRKKFPEVIAEVSTVYLEDTSRPNHLAQLKGAPFLKVEARTTGDLYQIRVQLSPIVRRNADRKARNIGVVNLNDDDAFSAPADPLDAVIDIREYDVAPVNRLAIDKKINVGYWYKVSPAGDESSEGDYEDGVQQEQQDENAIIEKDPDINVSHASDLFSAHLTRLPEIVERASPVVLAYDIECTKKPLKFPDPEAGDKVMMISWMVDGKGYLVINREEFSKDIDDFEFNPHAEFRGAFKVFNERDEKALLQRFFSEIRIAAPRVFVTYNGDFFDWPFVETRAAILGIEMRKEIAMGGVADNRAMASKETRGRPAIHMDVMHWVNRDSYLPQGSRGLKAVTRTLLGFEPEEIPPEEMMTAAKERPEEMAKYSVSDAVCTYYLYMKYVHPFIFSLCNIIPLNPDDVLRKGSGTLCEMLLMAQAREKRIVAPNKHTDSAIGKLTEDGHVLESETYIGGHVEAIRTGIYRSDLPLAFNIDVNAIDDLERTLDETLEFAITIEGKTNMEDVLNYDEVKSKILKELNALRERPSRSEKPLIYHLDVSAMYPNIILTNRLQPHAIVTSAQCAACDFNGMSECQRDMEWTWRGDFFPASRGEAEMIQRRAAQEEREADRKRAELAAANEQAGDFREENGSTFAKRRRKYGDEKPNGAADLSTIANFDDPDALKSTTFRKRLKEYCRVNYKRTQQTQEIQKTATVCQRENPFYVDTVRAFRDRRYEYKALLKKQKKAKAEAKSSADQEALKKAENLVVLYDSLQLAHKCILNSFYGYVMRKGARWYSMEMAGIVTNTGGLIIRRAREFIDKVGLPLELDTDGIWCALPVSFPENFLFETKSGKKYSMSYICSVFNADVAANFTNHQYQDLVNPNTFQYQQHSECSILFEVDGPYKAMVLPASLEEGKSIKKRYAVFNNDGSLAELKGFEIKRRGELKLVKQFQGEIFDCFLQGTSLEECYRHVGRTCDKWLDILTSKGEGMSDSQLLELLAEQNNMSKALDEYLSANQKSCAITCAGRMQEFLGAEIVRDKGLATMYIISRKPDDTQVTSRAIPVKIFDFPNEVVRQKLLKKWMKTADQNDLGLRNLLDWEYYKGRLANAILKIVSIPAALQAIDNPVPRIEYPPWLVKRVRELKDQRKQRTVSSFYAAIPKGEKIQKTGPSKSLKDLANDTDRLAFEDIEDLPIRSWTNAKVAHRRAQAVVARRRRDEQLCLAPAQGKLSFNRRHPEAQAHRAREIVLRLLNQPHPDKKVDYAGWVRYAKRVWRAQRAVRVYRYAKKRERTGDMMLESDGSEREDEDDNDEKASKPTKLFGGESFAKRFGMQHSRAKRQKISAIPQAPVYLPDNFVVDLRQKNPPANYFRKKVVPLLGEGVLWQNICVSQTKGRPGEFDLWVLPVKKVGSYLETGDLQSLPLHVQRVLYYNSKKSEPPKIPGVSCERVKGFTLPRSQAVQYLFRLELSEAQFQNTDKDLTSVLNDAGVVDGVFGTQSPMEYEVIVSLGTICAPSKSITAKSTRTLMREGISLDDIVPKSGDALPYLSSSFESSDVSLQQAFMYGSHASDGTTRALYVIVAPLSKVVHVVAVSRAERLDVNLKRAWRSVAQQMESSNDPEVGSEHMMNTISNFQFSSSAFRTREEAWSDLASVLSRIRGASSRSPSASKTLLLVQWPGLGSAKQTGSIAQEKAEGADLPSVQECIPVTTGFPIVQLSPNDSDGSYAPVGWESQAISVAFRRFADISDWLSSQLSVSRFAGIPIGNVSSTNAHAQAIDVLVGRELMNRDHILWSSDSWLPDLGGLEEDDCSLQAEIHKFPEISAPGSYRSTCIDTELANIAVATILSSSHVNQVEGTDMAFDAAGIAASTAVIRKSRANGEGPKEIEGMVSGKTAAPLDEMASSAPAFRVLKELVANWDKVSLEGAPEVANVAKALLDHVHRWTRSETSVLYDPALARFLGWLIRKVFMQLVAELRTLGASVVYASVSRLILATPKTQTLDGLRYAGFLEKTLKSKALFRHVHFQPLLGVYSGLLFLDRFNYGALPAPEEGLILKGEVEQLQQNSNRGQRLYSSRDISYVRMVWDIARYLPTPVAVLWSQVVEEFIRRPMVHRIELEESRGQEDVVTVDDDPQVEKTKSLVSIPRGDGYREEVKALVQGMTGQLLEKVHEIREKSPTLVFPATPSMFTSSENAFRNCSLEFVRSLCHVLALDGASTEEVASMRSSLLQLLGVREFARESQFVDPALPVPLHDVICTFCNAVVDLDIARDSRLWAEDLTESEERTDRKIQSWACEYCGNRYDTRQIELDLTRIAQKIYTSYQVQDLVCAKCKLVKRENMSRHCGCSGAPFEVAITPESLGKQLFSLKNVADFHRFELLSETVAWMLEAS